MTILELRKMTGLSQKAFGKRYEIPWRTIQNWEGGASIPPAYVLKLLERCVKEDFDKRGNSMKYTVWSQVFNKDGSINTEQILAEFDSLDDAIRFADDDNIIRCSEHYTGEGDFWEAIEEATGATDDYTEFNAQGRVI